MKYKFQIKHILSDRIFPFFNWGLGNTEKEINKLKIGSFFSNFDLNKIFCNQWAEVIL